MLTLAHVYCQQVALQSCAMTNCGLILESILQAASDFVNDTEEALFMSRCFQFALRWGPACRAG